MTYDQRVRYWRWWFRLREVIVESPSSNYDLSVSLILFGMGCYLALPNDLFLGFGGAYQALAELGPEWAWALVFSGTGLWGVLVTLWPDRPSYLCRFMARFWMVFCLLSLLMNNLSLSPPPLSAVTYFTITLVSVINLIRTRSCGR